MKGFSQNVEKSQTRIGLLAGVSFFPVQQRMVQNADQFDLHIIPVASPEIGIQCVQYIGKKGFGISANINAGLFFTKYRFRIDSLEVNGEPEIPSFRLMGGTSLYMRFAVNALYEKRIKQSPWGIGCKLGVGFNYFQKANFTSSVDYSLVQTNLPVYNQIKTYINYTSKPKLDIPIQLNITYTTTNQSLFTIGFWAHLSPMVFHENEYVFYRGTYAEKGSINLVGYSFGISAGYAWAVPKGKKHKKA